MKVLEPEHKCHASFTYAGDELFPMTWIRADSLDRARLHRSTAKKVWLGVCGFSHRVFKAASDRQPLGQVAVIVFQDIGIGNGRCEEEGRCLARQCPLNRTPDSKLKKLLPSGEGWRSHQKALVQIQAFTETRHCKLFKGDASDGGIMLPLSPQQPRTVSP